MEPGFMNAASPLGLCENAIPFLGKLRKREPLKQERSRSFIRPFSSRRLRIKLIVSAIVLLIVSLALPAPAQILITRQEVRHDVSPPLRDLARKAPAAPQEQPHEAEELRLIPLPQGLKPAEDPDPVLQKTMPSEALALGPTVINNFEGLGQGTTGFSIVGAPPDTNGAVGLTQYVQWVNTSFAVFDKTTSKMILGPVNGNTLWTGFGGDCEILNEGDPIVVYDKLADRWVFSQFAINRGFGPYSQCVAVSTTSDATGPFNRYVFSYSNLDDYPKMGAWPDAYYVTFNMFDVVLQTFLGSDVCAYDRNAMLNGRTATQICFQQGSSVGGLLPSDLDGLIPPPAGSPNFLMNFGANSLNLFRFHVDFANPANSTFTGPIVIPVAPFTPLCNGSSSCVPQPPGDSTRLDSLADRLMHRLAYRNFGDHESLVVNHSVGVDAGSGIRWYEVQNPNGTPTVVQQSTFAPDSSFRWMGSIAMDASGDMALGYSVSSDTIFPSISFTGRLAGDPANTMGAETSIIAGTGSQEFGLTRWGDYSAIQVDPVDDCTFWYTTEYMSTSGSFNWNTRIASFRFPSCGVPDLTVTKTHAGNFTQGQSGATYTMIVTNSGGKATDGTPVTVTDSLPAKLIATAVGGAGWTCVLGPPVSCTRSDALAASGSYPAITVTVNVAADAPGSVTNSVTVSGGGEKNTLNDTATDVTTVIQKSIDLALIKTHTGQFFFGQTGIYTLAVTNTGLSPTDGTAVTVSDTLPAGLGASSASGTGWTCLLGPPVSCTRSDVLAAGAAYPSITLTVSVAKNAPEFVVNTATVAGGGDANPLNNTATDAIRIVPAPPDLSLTITHTGNFNQSQDNAQYLLTVTNQGAGFLNGPVTVTDVLPAGLTVVSMVSADGQLWRCNLQTVSCSRNDFLAAGASYPPVILTVHVADDAPASVINTGTVTGLDDANPNNNTATDPTSINPSPDLTVSISHAPSAFTVGQAGAYTISVRNAGHASTSGTVTVSDSLPSGLTATAISGNGWTCSGAISLTCTRSDALAAGASYPAISVTVSVNGGGPAVTNVVTVGGGGEFNTSNDSAKDSANIVSATLTITKSHAGNFTLGQPGVYTITVGNAGQVATLGTVTMNDPLPGSITAVSLTGDGWSCSLTPVTCTRSDSLAPGNTYPPITLTVSIGNLSPNASGQATVNNMATVVGGGDPGFHFVNDLGVINVPTLAITQSHTPNPFIAGQTGSYTISVSNTGTVPTTGLVTVEDFVPLGLTATALGGTGWNCPSLTSRPVTCTRSDALAPNSSYPPVIMTVSINGGTTFVSNFAGVTGGGDADLILVNDNTVIKAPTLAITKTHTGLFTVGQTGTYNITVSNTGTGDTFGTVTVTDPLPFALTATAVSGAGWNCTAPPVTTLTCTRSDALAAGASYPAMTVTVSVGGAGTSAINRATVSGGGDPISHDAFDTTFFNSPILSIAKSHLGNFTDGQTGTYTIKVSNTGTAATIGTVRVMDALPQAFTATAMSGVGWSCPAPPFTALTCTRSDALAPSASYPEITLTVNVTNPGGIVANLASVDGGGDPVGHDVFDTTVVDAPVLTITKSHLGNFTVGQTGTYTITVNNAGTAATIGTVTARDIVPSVMTVQSVGGPGWICSIGTDLRCTRADPLPAGKSYPPITLTVKVDPIVPVNQVFNIVDVFGEGSNNANSRALDGTIINNAPVLSIVESHTPDPFITGRTGTYTITVSNVGQPSTTGTVTVTDNLPSGLTATSVVAPGWSCSNVPTPSVVCSRSDLLAPGASYPAIALTASIDFTAPDNVTNTVTLIGGGDSSTHSASDPTNIIHGLRFVPVRPCRVADTRNPAGPFGAPFLGGNTIRGFTIPNSACGIPLSALAYSINITVVPKAKLAFLTMYPCGQDLPATSTLNSDGRIKAAAAIVPAGTSGAVCAFATDDTEFILDINGYFVPAASTPSALSFYSLPPCRIVDTRLATGPLGGPSLVANAARIFPILSSSCNLPSTAQAYSLNFTSVPKAGKLDFLTTWPAGQTQPLVSTLNASTGKVTANAAIVPAGTNGDISVFVTNDSDLVIDINGYFAPSGPGGLSFFPITPCRAKDTRNPAGSPPFTGALDINVGASGCGTPTAAQSYVLNATVVPPGPLGFLTLWPQGATQPLVSTLNAGDGAITSNMAIVPTANGSVSAFVSDPSHLVLDISGFFAP
jgi:uncharacterized repeat protein (TIGR01451 family)